VQAQAFIRKWAPGGPAADLNERAGAQTHFIDLCRVLGVPEPADPDTYKPRRTNRDITRRWQRLTAGPTTRRPCPTQKSCGACWR